MSSTFPDISYHLSDDSSCAKAVKLNGGRNLAQVLLDIYNAIPDDQAEFKEKYRSKVNSWLEDDVFFIAPEVFPFRVWYDAGSLMASLFAPHTGTHWQIKCANIFSATI